MNKYKHDYYKLVEFADKFLMDNYGLKRKIPIRINDKYKTRLGYFTHYEDESQGEGAISITINSKLMHYATEEALYDILKHELVHYALYMSNLPYRDGDYYFEKELIRLDINPSGVWYVGVEYVTQCLECNELDILKNEAIAHNRNGKRKSRCCKSEFIFIGDIIFDGRELEMITFEFIKKIKGGRMVNV